MIEPMAAKRQSGIAIVTVLVFLLVIAAVVALRGGEELSQTQISMADTEARRIDYVAEAGLQRALWLAGDSSCSGDFTVPTTGLGPDSYSATTTGGGTTVPYVLSADQDAWIRSDNPTNTGGGDQHIRAEGGNIEQALYRFDLSSLPAGAQINSATAWFYLEGGKEHPEGPLRAQRILVDWTEAGATWDLLNGNFEAATLAMIPAQDTGGVWVQINLTGQVQAWVNGQPNYGIMLGTVAEGIHSEYKSREDGTYPPRLEVVVGTGPASPLNLQATGTLANGKTRTLMRLAASALQPPSIFTFQPDPAESADTEIWDQAPNNNYGDAAETWVSSATNDTTRSLLRFDMGKIPAGAKILEATLTLDRQSGSGANEPVSAHRITNPWSEDAVTWNEREAGTAWDTAGADFDATAVTTTPIGPANNLYEWDITPLAQGWVDGGYPNYGVALVAGIGGMVGHRFYTSDQAGVARRPILSVTYACQCGSACLAPQGSGDILMVVGDSANPATADEEIRSLLEAWGYTVQLVDDDMPAGTFAGFTSSNDGAYISATVSATTLGTKLTNLPIGVVSAVGDLNDELGIASSSGAPVGDSIDVVDNAHYITQMFPAAPLSFKTADTTLASVAGTVSPGATVLAQAGGAGSLVVLDTGAAMVGGGTTPARRVLVPVGGSTIGWNYLTNDGQLVLQRAIAWAMNVEAGLGVPLLLVVVNPSNLTAQEDAKKMLIESWGYTVNLIDESDSQANFDTAVGENNVVFITEDTSSGNVGTKLVNASIGVVTEEDNLSDEFGLSAGIQWEIGTTLTIDDNTHYITELFALGALQVMSSSESISRLTTPQSPDLIQLGSQSGEPMLAALDAGATTHTGGTAAGRRVQLPWGGSDMDVNSLNADGLTIFERALRWADGSGGSGGPGGGGGGSSPETILLVVGNAASPSVADMGRWKMMMDWGYNVTLFDDGEPQSSFDTAMAANDVVYVSGTVSGPTLLDRVTYTTTPVVNEKGSKLGNFGFSSSESGTASAAEFITTDAAHDITAPFGGGAVTVFNQSLSMPVPSGTLAPDLQSVGLVAFSVPALATLAEDATLWNGGSAPARRVHLPYSSATIDQMTADGLDIMHRAIEWAGEGAGDSNSPVAHWMLDDGTGTTAVDSAGSNDGTLLNGPTWVAGQIGDALRFDGSNDRVDVGTFDVTGSGLTLMVWFNADALPDAVDPRIVSKASSTAAADAWWQLSILTSSGNRNIRLRTKAGGTTSTLVDSSTNLNTGEWYFAVGTYDAGTGDMKLYLNGVEVASQGHPVGGAVDTSGSVPVAIGANGSTEQFFDGILDDVRVYDRALSASEISDLYTSGGGAPTTTFEVRVATSTDDAEEQVSSGSVNLTSSDLELISDGSNAQLVGMRFTNVTVPNGATITNAYVQFQVDETNSGTTNVNIQGQAIDDAPTFTTSTSNISTRSRTTATVLWAPVPWTTVGEQGLDQRTPNIAGVIKEIVDRPGWVSGNDIVIVITGSGERTAESYNGVSSAAALLHIEY